MRSLLLAASIALVWSTCSASPLLAQVESPLPSWNDGPSKQALIDFVERVTKEGGPDFVPVEDRVAVFDNDGTLWCEQPIYVQFAFALDRVRALAPQHPEWNEKEPFATILKGDVKGLAALGEKAFVEVVAATHAGMTPDDFKKTVRDWLATAKHPRFKRPYQECIYQPMIEALDYLRANGFKTFVVSGGGIEFMRAWTETAYGIPPEQIVGSSGKLKYELIDGRPEIIKLPEVDFVDNGPGKPIGIQQSIGRQPILAFGNSDGDFEMLEWTTAGDQQPESSASEPARPRPRLGLIIHHTDAEREYAYDCDSPVGTLDKALDAARARGWIVVSMKDDWNKIFPAP
ncbi:MAG: haloacid dehalogenase-like hydrolase [Pirellulales bacterium]|nr:haloacid dehalogenase-like hydrolase [Pirellulales bacterium]